MKSAGWASREERRSEIGAIALLMLTPIVLFWDVLFRGDTFFLRDLTYFYHPTKKVLREILLTGQIPYWNHAYSGGQPFAANPDFEVFYPLQALILLPSFELGYRLHILIHVPIALLGMYALLRSIRLRIFPSLIGALSFGAGGLFLSYINLLPILFTAAWAPWVLFFLRRFLRSPRLTTFAAAGGVLGIPLLAAEPTTIIQTGLLMAGYAMFRAVSEHDEPLIRNAARRLGQTACVILAGCCVAAIQILPTLDLLGDTARAGSMSFEFARSWSMPPVRSLEIVFPQLFGPRDESGLFMWGRSLYDGGKSPFLLSIYFGLLPAVTGIAGLFHRRAGRIALGLPIIAGFLLAIGDHTPMLEILFDAGIFRPFRYPEKFMLLAIFPMIVLAAVSLDRILGGDRQLLRTSLIVAAVIGLPAVVVAAFSFTPAYGPMFLRVWRIPSIAPAGLMIDVSSREWFMVAVRAALLSVLLFVALKRATLPRSWYAAVLLFVLYDLGVHSGEVADREPGRLLDPPAIAAHVPGNRAAFRLLNEADDRPLPSFGDATHWFIRNSLLRRTPLAWGFRTVLDGDYDLTNLAPTRELYEALLRTRDRGIRPTPEVFRAISNVGFVVSSREGGPHRYLQPLESQVPVVVTWSRQYPRYYFADQMVLLRDFDDFVEKTIRRQWSAAVAFVQIKPFAPAPGRVMSVIERPNDTVMEVESSGTGYLVISITPHRYWRATMDGAETELIRTNVGYQGMIVPAGRHRIALRYRNPWVVRGAACSLTALLALVVMALVESKAIATR